MGTRSVIPHTVEISPFAAWRDGAPEWTQVRVKRLTYDQLSVTVKVPTFSLTFYDAGGVFQSTFFEGDIVRIKKGNRLKFLGVINSKSPKKHDTHSLHLEGNAYYYDVLQRNYTVSNELFKEGGLPNVWKIGRENVIADSDEDDDLIDGVRPDLWIKALMGYKLIVQEFFDGLDGINNLDWFQRTPLDVSDVALSTATGWSDYMQSTTYRNGSYIVNSPTTLSYEISNAYQLAKQEEHGFYRDNVLLTTDDIVKFKYSGDEPSGNIRARIKIFQNESWTHPTSGAANTGIEVGDVYSGLSTARKTIAGPAPVDNGYYRVAISFYSNGPVEIQRKITFSSFEIIRNTSFLNVTVDDSRLCLRRLRSVNSRGLYSTEGMIKSIPFYAGNNSLKRPGDINGDIEIFARGEVYLREYTVADAKISMIPYGKKIGDRVSYHPRVFASMDGGDVWDIDSLLNEVTLEARDLDGNLFDYDSVVIEDNQLSEVPAEAQHKPKGILLDAIWRGTIATNEMTLSGSDRYKFAYQVSLEADGLHSPCVEYLRATADTESFLREATSITPFTYAPNHTAPTIGAVREYLYPFNLANEDTDKQAKYSTFAHEFFFENVWDALGVIIESTTKTNNPSRQGLSSFVDTLGWYHYNQAPIDVGTDSSGLLFTGVVGADAVVSHPYKDDWSVQLSSTPDSFIRFDQTPDKWNDQFTWWSQVVFRGISDGNIFDGQGDEGFRLSLNADGSLTASAKVIGGQVFTDTTSTGLIKPNEEYSLALIKDSNSIMSVWVNEKRVMRVRVSGETSDLNSLYHGGNGVDDSAQMDVIETLLFQRGLSASEINELSYPSFDSGDGAWNFQISHEGEVTFAENIGRYMGRNAREGITRRFSFEDANIELIEPKRTITDIVNALIYVAEGIPTISDLTLLGNEFIDQASVARYGMRIGRIAEKNIKDVFMANNRAHAILREMSLPQVELQVQLMGDLIEELNVGDIIHIRDNKVGVDDDFRIFEKNISVSETTEESTITLSTRNRTLGSLVQKIQKKFREIDNVQHGALAEATVGSDSQLVSKSNPYVIQVEIPTSARLSLQSVLLSVTSRAGLVSGEDGYAYGFVETEEADGTGDHVHLISNIKVQQLRQATSSNGLKIFPTNVIMSVNDSVGGAPYAPFGNRGVNKYGDRPDSQDTNIGFQLKDMDISDIFKDEEGKWIPGSYTLYLLSRGNDELENPDAIGTLSVAVRKTTTV